MSVRDRYEMIEFKGSTVIKRKTCLKLWSMYWREIKVSEEEWLAERGS